MQRNANLTTSFAPKKKTSVICQKKESIQIKLNKHNKNLEKATIQNDFQIIITKTQYQYIRLKEIFLNSLIHFLFCCDSYCFSLLYKTGLDKRFYKYIRYLIYIYCIGKSYYNKHHLLSLRTAGQKYQLLPIQKVHTSININYFILFILINNSFIERFTVLQCRC